MRLGVRAVSEQFSVSSREHWSTAQVAMGPPFRTMKEEASISTACDAAREPPGQRSPVRIGIVLSGGGLRGASHLGVLQELIAHEIPIDIIVGSSAGAVVAAYYAAVGLTVDDLIRDASHFRGRH